MNDKRTASTPRSRGCTRCSRAVKTRPAPSRLCPSLAVPFLVVVSLAAQPAAVPPHDHAFVATADVSEPLELLDTLRDHLIAAIDASGLAPIGYPGPCHLVTEPDPDHAGGSLLSCVESARGGTHPDGIGLDADGHFLQLSIVTFPDSRAYLAEVYLVPRLPYPPLGTDARLGVPRVALHFPSVPASWHPAIWTAIRRGLEAAGARAVETRNAPDGTCREPVDVDDLTGTRRADGQSSRSRRSLSDRR